MHPLTGVRILDLSTLLPGPLATLLLAEAGAHVTKVERPRGDEMRGYVPRLGAGMSAYFALLNRGKETVELDLKHAAGAARLWALIRDADVVIEQFRPGVMERLGFGYDRVQARNPRIVYCSITGYGQSGPDAQRAGHDINYLARSGVLALVTGTHARPALPPTPLADIAGGAYPAALNVALALLQRERTGHGTHLDIAMADNLLPLAYWGLGLLEVTGRDPVPAGELLTGGSPRYGFYETADGRFLAVAAVEDRFWRALLDALELDHADLDDRADPAVVFAALTARIRTRTAAEWNAHLGHLDVCCEVVRSLTEARADPHITHRELFARTVTTKDRSMAALPVPIASSLRIPDIARPAPPPWPSPHHHPYEGAPPA